MELVYRRAISMIEKEYSVYIDESYPLMKFLSQVEDLIFFREQEKKEMEEQEQRARFGAPSIPHR